MSSAVEAHFEGVVAPVGRDATAESNAESEINRTIIEPRSGWRVIDLDELWRSRELLYFMIWRDVKVRFKQTILGPAWVVLQPLATMIVFSLFLGRLGSAPSGRWPYPLFVFAGLLPWSFFAGAINSASLSVVNNQNLVTKIYFPRLIIPLGAIGAGLVDFAMAFVMLLIMMLYYGIIPGPSILWVPILTLGLAVAALGVGSLLAALTVAYRDFRSVVPFMIQTWMFATPIIYMQADSLLGPRWQYLLPLNPAYGLIANFRSSALGGGLDLYSLALSGGVSLAFLLVGLFYFRRVERGFADVI